MRYLITTTLFLFLIGCASEEKMRFLYAESHPDKMFQIEVNAVESEDLSEQKIKIFASQNGKKKHLIVDEKVSNQNTPLSRSNLHPKWYSQGAVLILNGLGQETKMLRVTVDLEKDEFFVKVE